jgi:hypothetical protein
MVTVRLVLCPSCVTQGVPDDKQEGSGGDGCGGNAQREEGEAYESFDAGSHYISHGTGFLSLFVLCSTLRRTNNYPLGLEGYEVHPTRGLSNLGQGATISALSTSTILGKLATAAGLLARKGY